MSKLFPLLAVSGLLSSFALLPAQPAVPAAPVAKASKAWPPVADLAALYQDKNYAGIRAATQGCDFDPAVHSTLAGARLLFYRGDALVREIHQSRAQQAPEADTPVAPERRSFELSYNQDAAKALDTALTFLTRAQEIDSLHNGSPYLADDPGLRSSISQALGLAAMEKALYVTQSPLDFATASSAYLDYSSLTRGEGDFIANDDYNRRATPLALVAQLTALVAQGKESDALELFRLWRKQKDTALRPHLAVATFAAAYDLVGEYERTRAFLLTLAMQQIQADGGKFDPAHHTVTRAALRAHLFNLTQALAMKSDANAPALRRVRVAGALQLRGQLTDEERAYILAVPKLADVMWLYRPGQAGQLRAMRLRLESSNPADQAAGRTALDAALKSTPDDGLARSLLGRCHLRARDNQAAVTELSTVIKNDLALAAISGALTDRAAAYTQLGRTAEAANDTRMNAQLENLIGRLAAP